MNAIISTIEYEISLLKKLLNSDYNYYSIYIFTLLLKHFADYILSIELNTQVSTFKYSKILKERKFISEEDEKFIHFCIRLTRRKTKLIDKFQTIDTKRILEIVESLQSKLNKFIKFNQFEYF